MIPFDRLTWQTAVAGRWATRIVGALLLLFFLAFVFGEGPPSLAQMTAQEQLYGLGVVILFLGLIVAWCWEGWGGLMSVLAWGYLAVLAGRPPWGLMFSIPAFVGLTHILCWWRLRGPVPASAPTDVAARVRLKRLFIFLWVFLAAFLLLCANEVFGRPPLMARGGRPPAGLVGTWHAKLTTVSLQTLPGEILVVFTIGPDGSVTGTVGNAALMRGRFTRNRSWFGRLMGWRTEYMIRGQLSAVVESYGGIAGDRFSAPLNLVGPELTGALFLSHPGTLKPLGLSLKKR